MEKVSTTSDSFSIVHFFLWFLFGTLIPGKYFLALILSIGFELLETFIIRQPNLRELFDRYWPIPQRYWNETIYNKILDIILNMTGYIMGSLFAFYISRSRSRHRDFEVSKGKK
jgi:hypothetical protein